MQRHYFVSEDLDELAFVEKELEASGVETPQIHILSEQDAELERHHLPDIDSLSKKNIVRSAEFGAVIGVCLAALVLISAYYTGVVAVITWLPFVFLAVVILGFCTWEGGLFGIHEMSEEFKRFEPELAQGKHVLMVDVDEQQTSLLERIVGFHPRLHSAGTGESPSFWVMGAHKTWNRFVRWAP